MAMKYLTPDELWGEDAAVVHAMFVRYTGYVRANWEYLTDCLREIQGSMVHPDGFEGSDQWISLHDADLLEAKVDDTSASLALVFRIDRQGDSEVVAVIYRGVQTANVSDLRVGDVLLYHEVEVLSSSCFNHRLLFQSGSVFEACFHSCELDRKRNGDA